MKTGFNQKIPKGQAVYDYSFESAHYITCLWCFYPIFVLITLLKHCKLWLYHNLNQAGIMQTPQGCIMRWKNLRVNDWLICNISKGVAKS